MNAHSVDPHAEGTIWTVNGDRVAGMDDRRNVVRRETPPKEIEFTRRLKKGSMILRSLLTGSRRELAAVSLLPFLRPRQAFARDAADNPPGAYPLDLYSPGAARASEAKPPSRSGWLVIAGLTSALLLGMAWLNLRSKPAVVPSVEVVRAVAVVNKPDDSALSFRGYVVPHRRISVNSKVTGRVAWIGVEKGERVSANQVVVRLEDDEFRAQLKQAEGAVANAKAYLEELENGPRPQEVAQAEHGLAQAQAAMVDAKVTLDRTTELAADGVVSKQVLDDARARFDTSKQQVDYLEQTMQLVKMGSRPEEIARAKGSLLQAEGQLAFAQSQLDATVIRAPISGTILERTVEKGELVTAQFATGAEDGPQGSVVAIANLNDVWVSIDVPQRDFGKIHLKQRAVVTLGAFPDRKYRGVVAEISPEASSPKDTIQVKVRVIAPDSRLRPQMNATVTLPLPATASRPEGVLVPTAGIHERNGKKVVVVARGGKATVREVQVVAQQSGGVLVHGISPGENVIVSAPEKLNDGDQVAIRRTP
jgi:HlyD family secretion protein